MQVAIDLPSDFVGMLTQDVVAREMRITYALALFKDARVTLAKAAELAGMNTLRHCHYVMRRGLLTPRCHARQGFFLTGKVIGGAPSPLVFLGELGALA